MAEDQSVIGKEQMYFDIKRGEMVICSDSEEENVKLEDVKHDFTEAEDQLLWKTLNEYGSNENVLSIIEEIVKTTASQIQERFEKLQEIKMSANKTSEDCHCRGCESDLGACLEESLSDTSKSLDKFFCRQCLIFNCALHGISQPLVYPEKQQPWSEPEGDRQPCSDQCVLLLKDVRLSSGEGSSKAKRVHPSETLPPKESLSSCKKMKTILYDSDLDVVGAGQSTMHDPKLTVSGSSNHGERDKEVVELHASNLDWKPLERDLYLKGVEVFGKDSCLITRNLLSGLRTCLEVASYMIAEEEKMLHGSMPLTDANNNDQDNAESTEQETPSKSQLQRKKGKYSRKCIGLSPRSRKKSNGKKRSTTQYTPCRCHGICTKECTCHRDGTRCEKFCGCSRFCTNRFRGCYCAKGQCRSNLCPCFAINRECDPDICRNCWARCNDGSPGELAVDGDGQCVNMNLLLGKKERILLAKSNVAGWGVFAKNPINKDACLGEYTGELITHREAEKRGKLYNRINHSFLFDLNDKASWVIDARRYGDKLKFANHSSKPNCYAKVMFVGGDHRVGIYAKENIKVGDEILYDYFYKKECAPSWARPHNEKASNQHRSIVSKHKTKVHESKEQNIYD
ncbi:enhancer of zeste [Vigna unguiculata]|uniref:Enhancer of zeste n=1 Tax=Vigna unguiculata TaxID=3917 RepID=A0A4D6MC12_VIGUN|nr:enhancer of zeste [Vigna unguiculata]